MKGPFAGRTIAIVHPAWHSCGTYQVVLGQADAWRSLGARVVTVAVSDQPGFSAERGWIWSAYRKATPELDLTERHVAGPRLRAALAPAFLKDVLWPYLHGDQAAIRTGMAERASLPDDLAETAFDLIHCNHFFCMPVARRIARGAPLMMESHDVQARQFTVQNEGAPWLKPHASYDAMLARELDQMRKADVLLHLNADEDAFFRAALPEMRHELLYPAVPPAPTGPGGEDIVIVSSRNRANVDSMLWFLREVAPHLDVAFKIVGSVDSGVRAMDSALHDKYRAAFLGRVDRLDEVYARARLALLPTIEGTGLSIKSVEAMASGLPLVATPQAFRGMKLDAGALDNVALAENAGDFARAVNAAAARPASDEAARKTSATRRAYDQHFSEAAYGRRLTEIAAPLLR